MLLSSHYKSITNSVAVATYCYTDDIVKKPKCVIADSFNHLIAAQNLCHHLVLLFTASTASLQPDSFIYIYNQS